MKGNESPVGVGFRVEGRYANSIKVGHNACEFVIEFGQFYREDDEVTEFHTRIITNPLHAKAFLETLLDSIDQYQRSFGTILSEDEYEHF